LKRFGAHVDWRRSFITTDINPFYDSFIRWQFNQLKQKNDKVLFGERYTIYSPLDGQACMDHDRKSGEGVGVQEYTGIKLKVLIDEICPKNEKLVSLEFKNKLENRNLYLVAATLRPETMYGQTNCFVGIDLDYGVYQVSATEAWICTERAARNMAFQNLFEEKGVIVKLFDLKGSDLVGVPLKAPLSFYEKVYTLPMEGVLATKGTGVVTSVPSDSPDDYITLMDLAKKAQYYKIDENWVKPFLPPKPIIETLKYGNLAAVWAVEELKIASQKDKEKLAKAKELVYKEGFYFGKMAVGSHAGKPVQTAKPIIRQELIDNGFAFPYCEPEGKVVSRSGDECVVSLVNQWYMNYGEEEWKKLALKCVEKMELYGDDTKNAFLKTLDWLKQWACSRSFGLGSKLPWDPVWLIESLSDSTIYMAFYTVAHILQEGVLDGSKKDTNCGIKPEDMTDDVWTYIMNDGPMPKSTIQPKFLEKLKSEFKFFYPLDLRTSGKDLINNHLTFFIYNHVAIFPEKNWPKGIRVNGHLLLNNEKMAKSTGNFMNLETALEKYGADATRFALADAGDGLEDANFLEKTADDAILKLFTEKDWIQEALAAKNRTGEYTWNDKVFLNELNLLIKQCQDAYEKMLYREVLKVGYYDLQNARNEYRKACTGQGLANVGAEEIFDGMHIDLIRKFAETQLLLLLPITPHWSEYVWKDLLGKKTTVMNCRFPVAGEVDDGLLAAAAYVRGLGAKIRSAEDTALKKKSKKGKATTVSDEPKKLILYVASSFPEWQEKVIEVLKSCYNPSTTTFNGDLELLKEKGLVKDKRVMPFVAMLKKSVLEHGQKAFNRKLDFNELEILNLNLDFIKRDLSNLRIKQVIIQKVEELDQSSAEWKVAEAAVPGVPLYAVLSQ
jgi:leucyl-tRNA synthetase